MTRFLGIVCMILRFIPYCTFVILLRMVVTLDPNALLGKCWIMVFIALPYFLMHMHTTGIVNNANEQVIFLVGMRCLNNPYYFVKSLICGALILRALPQSFCYVYILVAIDYVSKWVEAKATQTDDSHIVMILIF